MLKIRQTKASCGFGLCNVCGFFFFRYSVCFKAPNERKDYGVPKFQKCFRYEYAVGKVWTFGTSLQVSILDLSFSSISR